MNAKEKRRIKVKEKDDKVKERKRLKRQRNKKKKLDEAIWLKQQGKNAHHILPKSRGGTRRSDNISFVNVKSHSTYHSLFENLSPDEIVNYLIDYFWNGQTKWVFEAIANREN